MLIPESLLRHRHLTSTDNPTVMPTSSPTDSSQFNSAEASTTSGMIYTFIINVILFSVLIVVFEANRRYKQIFLKRYQKRFIEAGRIPPEPPNHLFGWLYAILKIEEIEVLSMVGLDAYMLLRYHVVCMKLCVFLTTFGLLVLLPCYGTVNSTYSQWDKYTLVNVLAATNPADRDRVWLAVFFGYIFSAYFCQLLHNEYNNFSNERIRCLQANHDGQVNDTTDNLPQKYYTIMLEKVPPELRSAEKLTEYFNELFPGDVSTIEVALDLRELNGVTAKRKEYRNKLEKAIANYIATKKRPIATVKKGNFLCFPNGFQHALFNLPWTSGVGSPSISHYLSKFFSRERFGYVKVDAINHYTEELIKLNSEAKKLQDQFVSVTDNDTELNKKMKNRYDSRAAFAVEKLGKASNNMIQRVNKVGIESIFFSDSQKTVNKTAAKISLRQVNNNTINRTITHSISSNNIIGREETHSNIKTAISHPDLHSHDAGHGLSRVASDSSISIASSRDSEYYMVHNDTHDLVVVDGHNHMSNVALDSRTSLSPTLDDELFMRDNLEVIHENEEKTKFEDQQTFNPLHQVDHDRPPSSTSSNPSPTSSQASTPTNQLTSHSNFQENPSQSKSNKLSKSLKPSKSKRRTMQLSLNPKARNVVNRAKNVGQQGLQQAKIAGVGAIRGGLELERMVEMLTVGAYYKYSSTAFVTFKSRTAETIAQQMVLSNDIIEISHGPNPHDVIWDNVSIPKSQVIMRNNITNAGLIIGSIFWSSLVTSINHLSKAFTLVPQEQNFISVVIILVFLLVLPFIFDTLARYYEGFKLESEIQNAIMTRYFYYQLVNIYVTIGLGRVELAKKATYLFLNPQLFIDLLGKAIPSLSLYFTDLLIVKIFAAIPLEMCRPYQLSTILLLGTVLDRQKLTRRELRSGAFYAWPMLYGWIYPQLLLVTMIIVTFACIAPLMMPFGILFFMFSYTMYKYQLLFVYVNDNQSLGFMWYAVFNRSLISLLFASCTLLACFAAHADDIGSGPFLMTVPLPVGILYFWHHCDATLKKTSMDLSYGLAKKIDHRNDERKLNHKPIPLETFKNDLYRQPTLTEPAQYPEPYRKSGDTASDILSENRRRNSLTPATERRRHSNSSDETFTSPGKGRADFRMRSMSINVHTVEDEIEENVEMLETYFRRFVLRRLCTVKHLEEKIYEHHTPLKIGTENTAAVLTQQPRQEISDDHVNVTIGQEHDDHEFDDYGLGDIGKAYHHIDATVNNNGNIISDNSNDTSPENKNTQSIKKSEDYHAVHVFEDDSTPDI